MSRAVISGVVDATTAARAAMTGVDRRAKAVADRVAMFLRAVVIAQVVSVRAVLVLRAVIVAMVRAVADVQMTVVLMTGAERGGVVLGVTLSRACR